MPETPTHFLLLLLAYLTGSIPFGLILGRAMGKGDLREQGSGNIGATNAVRVGGKKFGALVLLCDAAKGAIAVLIAPGIGASMMVAVVIGHIFPIWLRFKGGKGVATALGALLAFFLKLGLLALITWIIVFALKRISGLAAMVTFLLVPFYAAFLFQITGFYLLCILIVCVLVLWRHRGNLKALVRKS